MWEMAKKSCGYESDFDITVNVFKFLLIAIAFYLKIQDKLAIVIT